MDLRRNAAEATFCGQRRNRKTPEKAADTCLGSRLHDWETDSQSGSGCNQGTILNRAFVMPLNFLEGGWAFHSAENLVSAAAFNAERNLHYRISRANQ